MYKNANRNFQIFIIWICYYPPLDVFCIIIGIKILQVYLSGYGDEQVQMVLDVWKFSTMDNGEQSVMLVGI
jgi:hypothetical protein